MKIQPNQKELARSDGILATIVRPDHQAGGYLVAVVSVRTHEAVWARAGVPKAKVGRVLASDLRMLDKCGSDSTTAAASRARGK